MFKTPTSKSKIFGDNKESPKTGLFATENFAGLFGSQELSEKVIFSKKTKNQPKSFGQSVSGIESMFNANQNK